LFLTVTTPGVAVDAMWSSRLVVVPPAAGWQVGVLLMICVAGLAARFVTNPGCRRSERSVTLIVLSPRENAGLISP
jgi:hypothetical protein